MTKVRIDFYKMSGKWYSSFEFNSELPVFEIPKINTEAKLKHEFIRGMSYTIEVEGGAKGWNKYLFI